MVFSGNILYMGKIVEPPPENTKLTRCSEYSIPKTTGEAGHHDGQLSRCATSTPGGRTGGSSQKRGTRVPGMGHHHHARGEATPVGKSAGSTIPGTRNFY